MSAKQELVLSRIRDGFLHKIITSASIWPTCTVAVNLQAIKERKHF
jgi:hypothetical protein